MDDLSARTGEAKASAYVGDKGPDVGAARTRRNRVSCRPRGKGR